MSGNQYLSGSLDLSPSLAGVFGGIQQAQEEDRQALANAFQALQSQRYVQMTPLEIERQTLANQGSVFDNMTKELAGAQAQRQMTPDLLDKFAQAKGAAYNEAIRKDELGGLLQPHLKRQMPLEQEAKTRQLDIQDQITQIDSLLANGGVDQFGTQATPQQVEQWKKYRDELVTRQGQTAELSGKIALEDVKGWWDLQKAMESAKGQANAAKPGYVGALGPLQNMVSAYAKELADYDKDPMTDMITAQAAQSLGQDSQKFIAFKAQRKAQMQQAYQQAQQQFNALVGMLGITPQSTTSPAPTGALPAGVTLIK